MKTLATRLVFSAITLTTVPSCRQAGTGEGGKPVETASSPRRALLNAVAAPSTRAKAHNIRYASSSRNSSVGIDHPSLGGITRIAEEKAPAPRFVLLNPKGTHVIEERGSVVTYRPIAGEPVAELLSFSDGLLVAHDAEVETSQISRRYDGKGSHSRYHEDGRWETTGWAAREEDGRRTLVIELPLSGYHEDMVINHDFIQSYRISKSGEMTFDWQLKTEPGCAAIAADGSIVLGTKRGALMVFDASGTQIFESKLGFTPVDLSITDEGFAFITRAATGKQTIHMIDRKGAPLWTLDAPFELAQPAIEGGNGRVYLAGRGFAAMDGGKLAWGQPADRDVRATAYRDGWVAVASGDQLSLVNREGVAEKAFRTEDGTAIGAPPAIGLDGSAWFATAKALYVAR